MDPITIGMALLNLAPSLLKVFGEEKPATVLEKVTDIAKSITGQQEPDKALAAIQADPELAMKYKDAAEARAAEIIKAYLMDVQSARARDIEIQKARGSNTRADILVACTVIGIVVCIALACAVSELSEFAKSIVNISIGAFLATWQQVNNFEFGSTKASKVKDETITALSKESTQ